MAIRRLKGSQILDVVRRKISDASYMTYDDINEAQEWLAREGSFTWLRESNTNAVSLISGTSVYGLSHSNMRAIQSLWIAPTSTTSAGVVSAITLTGTSVVSITTNVVHGASTGDKVTFANVGGTTELNGNTYTITKTDTKNLTLDGTNSTLFTAWTSGGNVSLFTETSTAWSFMQETTARGYEDKVQEYSTSTTTNDSIIVTTTTAEVATTRTDIKWYYYLDTSTDSAQFWKIHITPTPSKSYKVKADYIRLQTEVTPTSYPDIPFGYYPALINYTAFLALIREENQFKQNLALKYESMAKADTLKMVWDSQKNRTSNIDKRRQLWQK